MLYQPKDPVGYRKLLTWKQAGEIYHQTKDFVRSYLKEMMDRRLINHLNDSARSVQRNIEEGFKRTTTKEYVQFLGFSRASLEELKGDFEELKREWKKGIRWGDKAREGMDKEADRDGTAVDKAKIRETVMRKIENLLNLIYGEDCMLGRQIGSLERKMFKEKTLPQKEMIKRSWKIMEAAEQKFWRLAQEKFGIEKDEKGMIKRRKKDRMA